MPNPYDEIFEEKNELEKPATNPPELSQIAFEADDRFKSDGKEPLDEILLNIQHFQKEAEAFSKLLTKTSAIDHKVINKVAQFFLVDLDADEQKHLKSERKYHQLLQDKFKNILIPMRDLAAIHLDIVKQFNRDIHKNYYSIEKTDKEVAADISFAVDGLNMQRKILAVAAADLEILKDALIDTEQNIKAFINAGGINNISSAEFEIIIQRSSTLISGRTHQFDYSFFDINLLDKTALSLGIYMKETSSQYLNKLKTAFEIN